MHNATVTTWPLAIRKWAGILSLVWVVLVPMLFKLFPGYFFFHIFRRDPNEWLGVVALVSWWPVGLLLAVVGFFSRSQVGRIAALLTGIAFPIFLLGCLIWPKLGFH